MEDAGVLGPTEGTVTSWNSAQRWAALASPDVAGEVFAHFTTIVLEADRRVLHEGQTVTFAYETPGWGRYPYRAVWVETVDTTEHVRSRLASKREAVRRIQRNMSASSIRVPTGGENPFDRVQGDPRSGMQAMKAIIDRACQSGDALTVDEWNSIVNEELDRRDL